MGSEAFCALAANNSVIPVYTERKPWLYPDSDHSARGHMHLVSHEALNVPKHKPYTRIQSLLLSLSNDFHMFPRIGVVVRWCVYCGQALTASSLVCGGGESLTCRNTQPGEMTF